MTEPNVLEQIETMIEADRTSRQDVDHAGLARETHYWLEQIRNELEARRHEQARQFKAIDSHLAVLTWALIFIAVLSLASLFR